VVYRTTPRGGGQCTAVH